MSEFEAGALRRRELLLATAALLGACGGVDSGGTGTGDRSTLSVGVISGFGSVIVNAVRFDDAMASLVDDEGVARTRDELRLGSRVEVEAGPVEVRAGVASAEAAAIRLRTELRGLVGAVDAVAGRFEVLGLPVDVSAATVMTVPLASLPPNSLVEVSGTLDLARRRHVATRVDLLSAAGSYKVRAAVTGLDLGNSTLDIGALRVNWSAVAVRDPALVLAPGRVIRISLSRVPVSGVWQALELEPQAPAVEDREAITIEGRISALVSAGSFAVDGVPVDAGSAVFPGGPSGLVLGAKIEVQGAVSGGVLRASRVSLEDDEGSDEAFELHGTVADFDGQARQFSVRAVMVEWTDNTRFEGSPAGTLANGRRVEVHGRLTAGGTRLVATRINIES